MASVLGGLKDLTRGPDNQPPVWVDKMKNIDFKKVQCAMPGKMSASWQLVAGGKGKNSRQAAKKA